MSDEPDRPRVITAPLGVSPAPAPEPAAPVTAKLEPPIPSPEPAQLTTARLVPAPVNAPRPATQMSASAVPSTLESPQEPQRDALAAKLTAPTDDAAALDEIHGAALLRGDAVRADASVPPELEATAPASRHGGPATMMSPAVAAPLPGASTPPLAPENAVVDVGAPAHAFVPYGSGAQPGFGGGAQGMMHHGGGAGRSTSTTFLVLVIGGIVAALAVLAIGIAGFFLFTSRRAADLDDPRGSRRPGGAVAPGSPEPPRLPPRMGGTRARVSVTSSGLLDPNAARAAIEGAMPHLEVCFAATELDPPNHESASYEVDVAPSGEVRRAEPAGPGARSAKLDACMVQSLRSVRMPRSSKPSAVRLTFFAPIEPR